MTQLRRCRRRCLLFVPGDRPERFLKAVNSGADMVCIDLEDAVRAEHKKMARDAALAFLASAPEGGELCLRINTMSSLDGLRDLLAIAESTVKPAMVLLPKVSSSTEVTLAYECLSPNGPGLVALLESPLAIEQAFTIALAPGLFALMLGGADYCAELGVALNAQALLYARSRLAAAAASKSLLAIDVPSLEIADQTLVERETRQVQELGFAAKAAIHPAQVASIQSVLSPDRESVERARRIVDGFRADPHAALQIDGKLVDRPIVLQAERILRSAGIS
jgi:citrate lyase beta subunit